jgi:hypothetical protein
MMHLLYASSAMATLVSPLARFQTAGVAAVFPRVRSTFSGELKCMTSWQMHWLMLTCQ